MRKLAVFNSVSLDGYFSGEKGDLGCAHTGHDDAEFNAFIQGNANSGGELLFGRITYELMASYWPTPNAMKTDPIVAKGMNSAPKIVFSKTLDKASWNNTKVIKGNIASEIRSMKKVPGEGMVIFGSGSIISQLASEDLIDEYQFVLTPVVLGKGRKMFEGIKKRLQLKLTKTRSFRNGKVFICYEPAA